MGPLCGSSAHSSICVNFSTFLHRAGSGTCVHVTHRPMSFERVNTNLQLIGHAENRVQLFSYSDGTHIELNFLKEGTCWWIQQYEKQKLIIWNWNVLLYLICALLSICSTDHSTLVRENRALFSYISELSAICSIADPRLFLFFINNLLSIGTVVHHKYYQGYTASPNVVMKARDCKNSSCLGSFTG